MTPQETAILRAIKGNGWLAQRDRLLLKSMFSVGLRSAELVSLTITDLDLAQGRLKVRRWPTGTEEIVPLPSSLFLEFKKWLTEQRPDVEHSGLWPRYEHTGRVAGPPLAPDGIKQMLRRRRRAAGLTVIPEHIRHGTATENITRSGAANPSEYKELDAHLAAFLLSRRNVKRSPLTLSWYERHIRNWASWLTTTGRLADWLGADTLDAYLEYERGRGLSDSSVRSGYNCLRSFLRWLRKRKRITVLLEDLPTALVDAPPVKNKRPRQADYEDLQKVIGSIYDDTWLDFRDRCLLTLMLTTGLRVDEAVNVRVEDVKLKTGFVFVADGKGERPRIVPFDSEFRLAFTAWILNRPATVQGRLFIASDRWERPRATGITTAMVRGLLQRRCAAAKVAYINPHSIRHLFAIKALNDGVQLSAVSTMLGHQSTAFTAKAYARWIQAGLRKEYDDHWKSRRPKRERPQPLASVPQPT